MKHWLSMYPDVEERAMMVEKYIAGWYTEPNMTKVLSVEATPVVPPGENFLSFLWRLAVKVQLKTGEVKERSLVFKCMPDDEERKEAVVHLNTFIREILTYELVLKKMDEIMTEFKIDFCRPWCKFISQQNYQEILLEDLKPLGYATPDQLEGLTLEETQLVFKALGRFHAASKAALDKGRIKLTDLKSRAISISTKYIEEYYVKPFRFLSQAIDESWGPQWKDIPAKLDKTAEHIINKMAKTVEVDESRFNTVSHGDLWTNNIMIQKDSSGTPETVKFVDFQLSFYATIGWDIIYLSYTSLSHSLRKEHLNSLIKMYLDNLQQDLRKYGYPKDKIPTDEYLQNELKRLRFWALTTMVFYVPIILSGPAGNEDAALLLHASPNVTTVPKIYQSEIFRNHVGEDIIEFINEGVME